MASNERPVSTARFTLSATVSNTGDRYSPPTTLRYYRSTDTTITTSDTEVGMRAVPALNAAGTSPWSILLTAPSPGTWYYGACVDAVTGESDTMNNCSSSVTVTVGPLPVPDLVVGSPMASNEQARVHSEIHLVGEGEQHGRSIVAFHDAAVLPLDGRDDHAIGHGGGHGHDPRA